MKNTTTILVLLAWFSAAQFAGATNRRVTNFEDSGPGTLRDTIAASAAGDSIDFAVGLGVVTITLTSGELVISRDLTIVGRGAGFFVIDGNNASRVFHIMAGTVNISGMTITGGRVIGDQRYYGTGRAGTGGGILNEGALTLTDCVLRGNSAIGGDPGYDIYGWGQGGDGQGGGIFDRGTLALRNCTVTDNVARGDIRGAGGGIWSEGTDVSLVNCAIVRNSASGGNNWDLSHFPLGAGSGGGIAGWGPMALTSCTISGNAALGGRGNVRIPGGSGSGGGIAVTGKVALASCTISGNFAYGGNFFVVSGYSLAGGIAVGPSSTMKNVLVSGNFVGIHGDGPDVVGAIASLGFNLISRTNGSTGWIANDLTGSIATPLDPLLGLLQDNGGPTPTIALLPGSAAIDAGSSSATTDQRGQPRVFDYAVIANASGGNGSDIGAYEVQGPVITSQPQPASQFVAAGASATFTVGIAAASTPILLWYKDGVSIPGANGTSYTRDNVQLADAGNYSVLVGDAYGSPATSSAAANLTVGFTLKANVLGGGMVFQRPDLTLYTNNSTVTLTATWASGWFFQGWSGDASGTNNPLEIVMTAHKAITAHFVPVFNLTLATNGSGTVARSPDETSYLSNSIVSVTATPSPGWQFSGWSGSARGRSNPLSLTMTNNKSITANFLYGFTLATTSEGGGGVWKDLDLPSYPPNSVVTLRAVPDAGWTFTGWSGAASGTANSLAVMMNSNKSVKATFTPPALSPAGCVPLPLGDVSWWRAEEEGYQGQYPPDELGRNQAVMWNTTLAPGRVGKAFSFNGTNSFVNISSRPSLSFNGPFSMEAWVRPAQVDSLAMILGKGNSYHVAVSAGGKLEFSVTDPYYGPTVLETQNPVLTANQWSHVAATFDLNAPRMTLYVNGQAVPVVVVASAYLQQILVDNSTLVLGVNFPGGITNWFSGLLDELTLYSRELTAGEVATVYSAGSAGKCLNTMCAAVPSGCVAWWPGAGSGVDVAGTHDGTLVNGVLFFPGEVGRAFRMSSGAYVDFGPEVGNFGAEDFSIDLWFESEPGAFEALGGILGKGNLCSTLNRWHLYIAGGLGFDLVEDVDQNKNSSVTSTRLLDDRAFHHMAVVRRGPTLELYVDGVLNDSRTSATVLAVENTESLEAGRTVCDGVGGNYFNGILDEIAIYNRALSASEVLSIYRAAGFGKCGLPPLIMRTGKSGLAVELQWFAVEGLTYRVQYKTNLMDAAWSMSGDVLATGSTASKTDVVPANTPQRFYRVELLR